MKLEEIKKEHAEKPLTPSGQKREEPTIPPGGKGTFENYASKEARKYNSFIENLLGEGAITKEEIMRIDAEIENNLVNKIEDIRNKKEYGWHDEEQKYKLQLSYFGKANKIYDGTATVFAGRMNSVTHAPATKKVEGKFVDTVKDEDGNGRMFFEPHAKGFRLMEEIEELRKSAIEKLIKERKQ